MPRDHQPFALALEPDDYTVSRRLTGAAVEPTSPMPVDLFDDRRIVSSEPLAPAWSRSNCRRK